MVRRLPVGAWYLLREASGREEAASEEVAEEATPIGVRRRELLGYALGPLLYLWSSRQAAGTRVLTAPASA